MKDLSRLIHAVTEEESESVIRYYSLNNNGASKRLKLFNMVRWKDIHDDRMAAKKLYNSGPGAAFSQLKKRLKEDILNVLLTRESCPAKSPKNIVDAEALALKYILYGKMLLNRGLTEEAIDVLKKAFKLAREHEAFEVQALVHSVFKTYSINHHSRELKDAEQDFAEHVDDFYELMKLNLNLAERPATRPALTIGLRPVLQRPTQKRNASLRLYFLSTHQDLQKYLQYKNYEQAQDIGHKLLVQIRENGHLLSSSQKACFFSIISQVKLALEHFDEAIYYGKKSSDLFQSFEEKKLEALIVIFKSYFYRREYEKAGRILKSCAEMEEHLGQEKSELPLFQAFQLFRQRNYRSSVKALNTFFRRTKPRIEVVLNGRLLELQNLVEMEDFDWFDYKLDSFRKIVKYHTSMQLSERFVLIYKIFSEFKRSCYDKEHLLQNGKCQLIQKLMDNQSDCRWDPLGTELVPVHSWFLDQIKH